MKRWFRATFQSLTNRNYRLYFAGQSVSVMGTWAQKVAQAWLVLELTDSGTLLGVTVAVQQVPSLLLTPFGGLLADRFDKRRILLVTGILSMIPALILGILTLRHAATIWVVMVLALAVGCLEAIDKPTRHTFVGELVGRDHLTNAVSLNSIVQNAGKVVGPGVAGVLITTVGLPISFLINAASFLTLIVGLLLMDAAAIDRPVPAPRKPGQVREGLRYVRRRPELAGPLVLMAITGTLAYNFTVTVPLLGRDAFGGDARTVGYLFTAMGLGAILGALALAGTMVASTRRLVIGGLCFGAVLVATSFAPTAWAAMALMFLVGAASVGLRAVATSLLQLRADPEMRGRVIALFVVSTGGTTPIGGPIIGAIGERFGAQATFLIGGLSTALAVGVLYLYRPRPARQDQPVPGDAGEVSAPAELAELRRPAT
jgi:MFS family permease